MSAFHPKQTFPLEAAFGALQTLDYFGIDGQMPRGPSLKERLDRPTLLRLYEFSRLSTVQIAERYGVKSPSILKLMDEYGIPRRTTGAGKT